MVIVMSNNYYVPFLSFYKDEIYFCYQFWNAKEYQGSITHKINDAFVTSDLEEAKKAFNKKLRVVAPKNLWKQYGFLKIKYENLRAVISHLIKTQTNECNHYSDITSCGLIEIIHGDRDE